MKYKVRLRIEGLPKRINQTKGVKWFMVANEAKKWMGLVDEALQGYKPTTPLAKARVSYVRHSSMEPDWDGLVGAFKPVQDALKKLGIIKDDKMSVIGQPNYLWLKCPPKKGHIEIEVEEL